MAADRNLLFGLLALQNGLMSQRQLVAAFQAWTLDKSKTLAAHLEARGDLTGSKRAILEALAEVHLEAHDGDATKSLAAVTPGKATCERLARIGDPDLDATLDQVGCGFGSDPTDDGNTDRTSSYAFGEATSSPIASGFCGRMRGAGWAPCSWHATQSLTARSRSSRFSSITPTIPPVAPVRARSRGDRRT